MVRGQSFGLVLSAVMMFGIVMQGEQAVISRSTAVNGGAARPMPASHHPTAEMKRSKVSWWRRHEAKKAFLAGAREMEKNDPRGAETHFARAHNLNPSDRDYFVSAEIARQYQVTQLVQRAEKEHALGNTLDSLETLQEAIHLDPDSRLAAEYVDTLAVSAFAKPNVMRPEKDEAATPIELAAQKGRGTFHLKADEPSVISQVLNDYGIQATVDDSVGTQMVRFDATDVDFAEAAKLVKLATNTFLVPLDSRYVLAVADTKENRRKYERVATETIYLPALSPSELSEMGDIVRGLFGVNDATVQASQNTLTVRAPLRELAALNRVCREMLVGRSELQLDVRIYEIDKTRTTDVGVVLPSSTTMFNVPSEINSILADNATLIKQLLASDPALAGNYAAILAALIGSGALTGTVFNNPFAVFGGGLTEMGLDLNGASANLLLNSSDVRLLNEVQLRVVDQEEATIRSGERYPIVTSSFSSLLGSSSSTLTLPQIQYQDLGLTLRVKPHVEGENEMSLNLDLKLDSLGGSTINNIPVLNNRQYEGIISLHLGESALVVSDMSKQDSREIMGIPGLSDIPGFQYATNHQDMTDSMELAIVITPHLVRTAHRDAVEPMLLLSQH